MANEEAAAKKLLRVEETNDEQTQIEPTEQLTNTSEMPVTDISEDVNAVPIIAVVVPVATTTDTTHTILMENVIVENENMNSPSRRGSQESNATTTTTGTATTTTTGSDSTSSSSSNSSSSDSSSSDDSESESSEDDAKNADSPLSENELESIYKICIKNLEECVTRFPEHYKSIYRLVNIYLNAPEKVKDLKRCKQLLLGTYTTGLGNQIQGLFSERKANNFFNVSSVSF